MPNPSTDAAPHDIALDRERLRHHRVYRLAAIVITIEAYLIVMPLSGRDPIPPMPTIDPLIVAPVAFFIALIALLVGTQVMAGRSPHLIYRPEQMDVTLDDVIFHVSMEELPFGGIGPSGMGSYHGHDGFKTFSHARAVFRQPKIDITKLAGLRPPYGAAIRRTIAQGMK